MRRPSPAMYRVMSIASCTSPAASSLTFPISRLIRSARSSLCSAIRFAKRYRTSARFGAGTSRHVSNAVLADATARSTSSGVDRGNSPRTSPVAGTIDSNVSPPAASTHSPPTKFLKCFVPRIAMGTSVVRRWLALDDVGERPRDPRAAAVARLPLLALGRLRSLTPVGPRTPVDDHGHVRVLLVVLDHPVVELVLELRRDHAIDHCI